jgi:DNA-binding CsgD family transcriptional regulator
MATTPSPLVIQFGEAIRRPGPSASIGAPAGAALLLAAFNQLPLAVLIVTAAGHVQGSNIAARELLSAGDGLWLLGSLLKVGLPTENGALHAAIRAALQPLSVRTRASEIVTISRPSGAAPYVLLVASLPTATPDTEHAMILIGDLEWPGIAAGAQLRQVFGLTEAEAEVAAALINGHDPREIARRRGVETSTIRTQVKRILGKAGVRRQVDLVKLVARLPVLRPR